jgi:VCBS repeat-containing protein
VGSHPVTVTVTDEHGAVATQSFTIVVTNTNDAPVAFDDLASLTEDAVTNTATGNVLTNDVEVDLGDTKTVSPALVSANGTFGMLDVAANGAFTYTLDNARAAVQALAKDETGDDSFDYTVTDGTANDTGAVVVTVTGINDDPTFTSSPSLAIDEDSPYSYTVTVDDVDNGATLTVDATVLPSWLTFAGNTLSGTPLNANVGSHPVTLTVTDEHGAVATQSFTIVVSNTNDAPVANADTNAVTEDAVPNTATGNVLTNDVEVDAIDAINVTEVEGAPANVGALVTGTYGDVTIAANGAYTYTLVNARAVVQALRQGATVTDVFDYTISDGDVSSASTLTITITGANDPTVAAPDDYSLPLSGTLNATSVLANDTDADTFPVADTRTAVLVSDDTTQGTLAFQGDGTFTYTKTCTDPCANDSDSFTYRVNDGFASSNTVTVTIVYNSPPVADDDALSTNEDVPLTINAADLLAGDSDADGNGTIDKIVVVSGPTPSGSFTGLAGDNSIAASGGSFTFTPAADFVGAVTFTYKLVDQGLLESNVASVTITVAAINDAPFYTPGSLVINLNEDFGTYNQPWATGVRPGPVTATDEASQTLTFRVLDDMVSWPVATIDERPMACVVDPVDGMVCGAPPFAGGAFSGSGPTRNLTFQSLPNEHGTWRFEVDLQDDGGTANGGIDTYPATPTSIEVNVLEVNDRPSFSFSQPTIRQVEEEGLLSLPTFGQNFNSGAYNEAQSVLEYLVTADHPAMFSELSISPAGVLRMNPALNAYGHTNVRVRVRDNGGTANGGLDTSLELVCPIEYIAINDAPSFVKGPDISVAQDSSAYSQSWIVSSSVGPANEVTPPTFFHSPNPFPASPAWTPQTISYEITANSNPNLFQVAPAVTPAGVLTFTPKAATSGAATITIRARDNGGTNRGGVDASATQTFAIVVGNVNAPPTFDIGASQTLPEDSPAQTLLNFVSNVTPGVNGAGQTVTFGISNNNSLLFAVTPQLVANGANYNLTFTPAPNAFGTATVTITATDNGGTAGGGIASAQKQFTITLTGINDPPSFSIPAPNQSVFEGSGLQTVNGFATAISKGPSNETNPTFTFLVTGNTNPTLFSGAPAISATGVLTYTPKPGETGSATITVVLRDNNGTNLNPDDDAQSAPANFTITVNPFSGNVNDAPTFTKGANQTVAEDTTAQTIAGWATGITQGGDDTGQTVSFLVTANTNTGLFSAQPAVSSAGVLTYTPNANAFGTATITLVARDNGGTAGGGSDTSAPQTFTITITAVNDPPTFNGTNVFVASSTVTATAHTIAGWATGVSAGPNETQTLTRTVVVVSGASLFTAGGQPAVNASNALTFTTAVGQSGTATIDVTFTDNGGAPGVNFVTKTFTIGVGVNSPPSFTKGPNVTVNEDSGGYSAAWATAISQGLPSESGQVVTFEIVANSNTLLFSAGPTVLSDGTLQFTPDANRFGVATIDIRAKDDAGTPGVPGDDLAGATQTFTITINNVNDPPTFSLAGNPPSTESEGLNATYTIPNFATSISPGPFETGTVTFSIIGNTTPGLFSGTPAISSTGTLTYTIVANQVGSSTLTVRASDGSANSVATPTFTVTVVNTGALTPVVPTRNYTTTANMTLTVDASPNRLLDGITDPTPAAGTPLTLKTTFTGVDSGATMTVTDAATGAFTYTPKLGFVGTDTFTYQVCDGTQPTAKCGTGTINMQVVGPIIYYVKKPASPAEVGGNGTLQAPFDSISEVSFFSLPTNAVVFVFSGNYTDHTGQSLYGTQRIIGQGAPIFGPAWSGTFASNLGITAPVGGTNAAYPDLNAGSTPVITGKAGGGPGLPDGFGAGDFLTARGTNTIRNFKFISLGGRGVQTDNQPGDTVTVDRLSLEWQGPASWLGALGMSNSRGSIVLSNSHFKDVAITHYNGGGGLTVTGSKFEGQPRIGSSMFFHLENNGSTPITFDSTTTMNLGAPIYVDASTNVTFNGPVQFYASLAGRPAILVGNGGNLRMTGKVDIDLTVTDGSTGIQVQNSTFAMTNTQNTLKFSGFHNYAMFFQNVTVGTGGVIINSIDTTNAGLRFENTSGATININSGTIRYSTFNSPCIERISAPNVAVGGSVVGVGCTVP